MTDVTTPLALSRPWALAAAQINPLLQALPLPPGAPILLLLPGAQAHAALLTATAAQGLNVVSMPVDSTADCVKAAMADTQPCVVVCDPSMFCWVSKLAFWQGCLAVYTCAEDGEGTLLNRAAHGVPALLDVPAKQAAQVAYRDGKGQPMP